MKMGIPAGYLLHNGQRLIGARIIDENDLKGLVEILDRFSNAFVERQDVASFVVHRGNDGKSGGMHASYQSLVKKYSLTAAMIYSISSSVSSAKTGSARF